MLLSSALALIRICISRWQTAIGLAPSICMRDFGVHPVGTSHGNAYRSHVLHMLTPETESTTHCFWSVACNQHLGDKSGTQGIYKSFVQTFDEDGVVLAIQQKQIEKYGGPVPRVAMKVDEAPTRARRQLEALIKRENEDPNFVYRPELMMEDTTPELSMVLDNGSLHAPECDSWCDCWRPADTPPAHGAVGPERYGCGLLSGELHRSYPGRNSLVIQQYDTATLQRITRGTAARCL
jgi:hypothetical protein